MRELLYLILIVIVLGLAVTVIGMSDIQPTILEKNQATDLKAVEEGWTGSTITTRQIGFSQAQPIEVRKVQQS